MKIVADTNVLLRNALLDDPHQARVAAEAIRNANVIAIPVSVLCEFVWVLRQGYGKSCPEVADAIRTLLNNDKVAFNTLAVQSGLRVLDSGGDFADGVIAHEGAWLGADEFVSFDKQAVKLLKSQGKQARLLS